MIFFAISLIGEYIERRIPVLLYGINLTVAMVCIYRIEDILKKLDLLITNWILRLFSQLAIIVLAMIVYGFATITTSAFPLLRNIVYLTVPILFLISVKR